MANINEKIEDFIWFLAGLETQDTNGECIDGDTDMGFYIPYARATWDIVKDEKISFKIKTQEKNLADVKEELDEFDGVEYETEDEDFGHYTIKGVYKPTEE